MVELVSFGVVILVIATIWVLLVVNWIWLRPKKLERWLRQQGLSGKSYQISFGVSEEESNMRNEAESITLKVSDDVVPKISFSFDKNVKTYGKNCFVWAGTVLSVIIMNPKHLKDIFNNYNDFRKPNINFFIRYVADGIILDDGEKWAKRRKIINPAFHLAKLKNMLPAFDLSCSEMISQWENLVCKEGGSCELDIWPYFQYLTADVISRTAFGSSYEKGTRIFELQREQAHTMTKAIQNSKNIPGWRFVPTKLHRRMKDIDNNVKALLKDMIKEREKAMKSGEANNDDLLSVLLESNLKEIQENKNMKKVNRLMSIDDIVRECKLFYFAGQETSSVLLVWTMVLLSVNPDWQARAREEVLQVFGTKKPDFDGISHLKIVTMILYEVLRLYPPVTTLLRVVEKKTQLGEMSLPSGIQIYVPTLLIQHDTELWGEDAKEFKPERFAEGVSKATKGQISFFPFGWGPRICIGQNFALIEAKLALSLILQHFRFELSPTYTHSPFVNVTLQPKHGAHIVLHKH
ncbi:Cytochrome P450, E-class, group I [Trema orientale]|uniref:Cytochrome P450, E-class, group I n=1 Tax=Trema orientale TaxID=63057 RepID=A0A2P5FLF3_TREOI|nr:Cytochrome P450, E-class, group I [Trema orientale]